MLSTHLGELASLATAILWTVSSIFFTSAGKRIGALPVSFLRIVIACVLLVACTPLAAGRWLPTDADGRAWLLLGISGFLGFFLCDVCLFKAMLLIGPRRVLLIFSLTPPIAALASFVIGDALSLRSWVAMAITLAGVAWVVLERPNHDEEPPIPGMSLLKAHRCGVALALFATATSAIGMVVSREVMLDYHNVAGATLIRALAALPGYVVLTTAWRRWRVLFLVLRDPPARTALGIGSVLGSFGGSLLMMVGLRYSSAGVVTTITATMPVLILPLSIAVYHERISFRAVAGAVVAVAGVALLML